MINSFKKLEKKHKFIFALIIGVAVALFWRGIWGIADELIFPDNYLLSSVVSVIIALIILSITNYLIK